MKIYVITKGCYSDYHICAVTEDREKAELLKEKYEDKYDAAVIEEYDTDDSNEIVRYKNVYLCKMHEYDDNYIEIRQRCWDSVEKEHYKVTESSFGPLYWFVSVNADTEEDALKIASDKFAQYKAEKMGL